MQRLRQSKASRQLVTMAAGFLVVMLLAIGGMVWLLHRDAISDARQNLARLSIAIAEQTSRALQAASLVLEELQADVTDRGIRTPEDFRRVLETQGVQAMLVGRNAGLPQLEAITIIGADGKLINFSRQWPIPPTDLSDRDYFTYFKAHNSTAVFVSEPVQNRGNGNWTAYVVRRVNGPGGVFLGMVLASIELPYFQSFYKSLTQGTAAMVALLRKDGTVLTSYPPLERVGFRLPDTSAWYRASQYGPESYIAKGTLAPGKRIVSVYPLTDYPLVVDVSMLVHDALVGWRRTVGLAGAGAASAMVCVLVLLRALLLQVGRIEESEASLGLQNGVLEGTQERMEQQARALSHSQAQLEEQTRVLETALEHMNQGIMMVSADRVVQVCNRRAMEMLDLPPHFMARKPMFDDVVRLQHQMNDFETPSPVSPDGASVGAAKLVTTPTLYERMRPNGRILEIASIPMRGGGMVRTYTDITLRRRSEAQVQYLADHDGLTKLVNRTVFQEKLEAAMAVAMAGHGSVAILYIDLDGFKQVNDTFGHGVGDKLLVQVSDRLRQVVQDADTVARMGGDEFAIIQPLIETQADCERLAAQMLTTITEPYRIGEVYCTVGLSIGIALYPAHAATAEELLRAADVALYRAKVEGKGLYRLFDSTMDLGQQQEFLLEQDLGRALMERQLFLEYQPIVDAQTLSLKGFEALVRWRHPLRGLIGPGDFIGLAERSGLIIPIGLWVMETACIEALKWPRDVHLSVNLSPMQFMRGDLAAQIAGVIGRTGIDADRLTLEVTEGLLLENTQAVVDTMVQVRASGVRFSLDDFGTAHAGLTYLRRFPFDVIKIDKSFVQDAAEQDEARAIVAAVLAIGTAFGLSVVAEGVETERQLALLRTMGCNLLQGYLTGRPLTAERIEDGMLAAS